MKKYLLIIISLVCAVTGAWAEVSYPYNFGSGSSVDWDATNSILTVTIGTTGDFATFTSMLQHAEGYTVSPNKLTHIRIKCTGSATISKTEVTSMNTAKADNIYTSLDLTDAAFETDAALSTLLGKGVNYVALPKGKSISDVTLKDDTTIKGVVTSASDGSNAAYTAYNGSDYSSNFIFFKTGSSLISVRSWTITNGAASGNITAGNQNSGVLSAIISNSTASTLSVTLDGITQDGSFTLSPSSSVVDLTISGLKFQNAYKDVTINSGGALTSLTIEDSAIPGSLTIDGCGELTTADLRGVKKKGEGALTVTFNDDPKLSNVTLYKSSSDASYSISGTTPTSGVTVTWATPAIPIEYNGCEVTFNLASRGSKTMAELLSTAKTALGETQMCTIIVTGEMSTTDLGALNGSDASGVTRIDMSEATLAVGANINSLNIPTSLTSLVLPAGKTVDATLAAKLQTPTNLKYAYSPTTDNQTANEQFVADYVWLVRSGGLAEAITNEAKLKTAIYVKVESTVDVGTPSNTVALNDADADLTGKGIKDADGGNHAWQYIDLSGTMLTPATALAFKAPHWRGFRIVLPNNVVTNEHMAMFASNSNIGSIAAVYTYNTTDESHKVLKIMECNDGSYSHSALTDPRVMKENTTEVNVVSGYYNGNTYAHFGTNLLTALNNMGDGTHEYAPGHANTRGISVTKVSIETTSAAPNALTFSNPTITTLEIKNLVQNNAELKFGQCSNLTTLDLSGSTLKSVSNKTVIDENTYTCTSITSVNLSRTAITTTTDFSGATSLVTFTTTDETSFNDALNLSNTGLTAFSTAARFGGDISFNGSNSLASIDVTAADFAISSSKIHIDLDAEKTENSAIISGLTADNCIQIPASFETSRLHPTPEPESRLVQQTAAVANAVDYTTSDMAFHDNNTGDAYYPTYRYWYQGNNNTKGIATLGVTAEHRLSAIIDDETETREEVSTKILTQDSHAKIKVVGPMTEADIEALDDLNCTMLDLSDATIPDGLLKTKIEERNILHENTKFLVLPDNYTREDIINGTALAKLSNVYCVLAVQNTSEGRDLTSWSRVSGALQPAVVGALSSTASSWSLTPENQSTRNIYTSSISNFKKLKISGLINSYDLAKANQKLDANGHLTWSESVVEAVSQTRTQNGAYEVYGPFSSCFLLTEIDLKNAYFEEWDPKTYDHTNFIRYWVSDMTLSELNVISTATYKVVIPQDSRVNEIPADFMHCATNIRAICIPSNIRVIRTRAFYTIDYVWTTSATGSGMENSDPEGTNTRLDNGAKLSNGTAVSALLYENGSYKENSAFLNSYYTADYSGIDGGGTYTFGSNIRMIETGAFANTQPNVKDVYVLNTTAPECHVDAFNTVMYTGNGGYNPILTGGIISRSNYYNGRWITMLHYPRQTATPNVQRYTDPTRQYSIATGERDGKGATLYFPNQSEFIRAYQQGTYGYIWNAWNPTRQFGSVDNGSLTNTTVGWTEEGQKTANALFDAYSSGTNHQYTSFYKVSSFSGKTVTAPTETLTPYNNVYWNESSYKSTSDTGYEQLYPQSEVDANIDNDNSGEKTSKDYRGWHQFVLNAYAANTVLDEEPYRSYIADNEWWTICPTFDITRKEAVQLFGTEAVPAKIPYVSKLRYVCHNYNNTSIKLNFSTNLMEKKEKRTNAKDQHGTRDTNDVLEIEDKTPGDDDVVMSAGVPYLIKPNMTANGGGFNRQFRVYTTEAYAKLTTEQKNATSPRAIESTNLYNKIAAAQSMGGEDQRTLVNTGKYTVPVFVTGTNTDVTTESADGSYTIDGELGYKKSSGYYYTFVGSFYNSYMPRYAYFLGWNGTHAQFFYNDGEYDGHNMRWANETGIICPTTSAFTYEVSEATSGSNGLVPAQWELNGKVANDSYVAKDGSLARNYLMTFDAPDVVATDGDATGISEAVSGSDGTVTGADDAPRIYSVDGQLRGNSLNGLGKGVYIVNGKKFVIK